MKKLLLVFTALCGFSAMAQTDSVKKHAPYFSIGANFSPKSPNSLSIEGGTWGISSNTSFGSTCDMVPRNDKNGTYQVWVGAKAYYTTHSEAKLCYMYYIAPKVCVNNKEGESKELIEFGFNPYYTLNKNILFGMAVGNQYLGSDSPWNMFLSGGFTFLFLN